VLVWTLFLRNALSIIIPTLGRKTLGRALSSVVREIRPEDQVIVVGDGPQPAARESVSKLISVEYYETEPSKCWGHAQRNLGMEKAIGTHLAFLDDDDVWLTGARRLIGETLKDHPERPIFFRMQHRNSILWHTKRIAFANVSTQMYVFPNIKGRLASWRSNPESVDGRGGDFLFAKETAVLWPPDAPIFMEHVIAKLYAHSEGRES
jgi:hypothetical protein